jgi:N-acetyl-anhydromuramyl-L-alanine amidase AmpD
MVTTSTNLTTRRTLGRAEPVSIIIVHTMEAPEAHTTAEAVANYFKTVNASAHWCVDDDSRVRCVQDDDTAWSAPPINPRSLNIEIAGYAGQTPAQWDDDYSRKALSIAALCAAEWCVKYDIPVRRIEGSQIFYSEKGLAGHVDVNNVYHQSTHWDPGPSFPWVKFLQMVRDEIPVVAGNVPVSPQKPNCTAYQKAIRTPADNLWGPMTDKHSTAIIEASGFGGYAFPYGIAFTQMVVGTTQDGLWGPKSIDALKSTTVNAQKALRDMGFSPGQIDGYWGPITDRAFQKARTACHI